MQGPQINLDTESGKRIYDAMKERALDRLIGYTVGEFTCGTKPNEPHRTIKTTKSLPEVSLVTFPMNELARSRPPTSARCVISRMPCARASFGIWRNHDALTICPISSQRGKREGMDPRKIFNLLIRTHRRRGASGCAPIDADDGRDASGDRRRDAGDGGRHAVLT
jgi:hypothetical protein